MPTLAQDDVDPQELVGRAQRAFSEGSYRESLDLYSRALNKNPSQSSLYAERGEVFEMLNQPQKAIDDYRKALHFDPSNRDAMKRLAGMYEQKPATFAEALQLYRRALNGETNTESKNQLLTSIAILQNRLQPEDASAVRCWHLGNQAVLRGDYTAAESLYTKAIALDPMMFQAYYSRGLLNSKADRFAEALGDFEQTVRISPTLRGAYVQKGLANLRLGNAEAARRDFEEAARVDPRDPNALYHFAVVLEERQDYDAALEKCHEALGRRPDHELRKSIQEKISRLELRRRSQPASKRTRHPRALW
ncbi:tetratricopeptide repeat protein [Desulfomonile tiedjei]|uniref:Tetratricopeptide repeat protein n=1 Tax=Desulfomonile tiedjei (strain ATCC 49306 / DSM 6799 / DCB-1) TaxID=706587 RepID=I4C5E6_DESTA|nr:tetratricopeptide repeat protein [Desulfomonile tiedjei]AFM24787.1 tetratricopeptide repeat protein [Desulfomonile tiedjei DSM 6799]